ncbi:hypothetical protein DSO57_1002073 [Entomophthora muscae]|uniref:Uncharacterized protein n=1 Tax=Entomophthora muscae TaxID=34485 RepID=A0ACC2RZR5_9FUNG|nr:hypothetical protein DSO57_1002073 [Entomophthora muscae]
MKLLYTVMMALGHGIPLSVTPILQPEQANSTPSFAPEILPSFLSGYYSRPNPPVAPNKGGIGIKPSEYIRPANEVRKGKYKDGGMRTEKRNLSGSTASRRSGQGNFQRYGSQMKQPGHSSSFRHEGKKVLVNPNLAPQAKVKEAPPPMAEDVGDGNIFKVLTPLFPSFI